MHLSFKEWFEVELQKDILKEDAMGQIDQLGKKFWQGLVNAITGTVGKIFGKDSSQPPPKPTPAPAPGTVTKKTPAEESKDKETVKKMGDQLTNQLVPAITSAMKSNNTQPTAKP
jgi:hypothetical protein